MSVEPSIDGANCPNCGTAYAGKYCSACGQKAAPLAPTLGYLCHELVHEFLSFDGKIFRSVRLLLTRPGFLTRELLLGRRASYVGPIRLYLIFSVLAFALVAFGIGGDGFRVTYTPSPGEIATAEDTAQSAEISRSVAAAIATWLPRAMFVLVPLFAALVMLFRRSSGRTYPQHLYFALHVHAAWFFANAANALLQAAASSWPSALTAIDFVTVAYIFGYCFIAFRRVYETTAFGTLWRLVLIGTVYGITLGLAMMAIGLPSMFAALAAQRS